MEERIGELKKIGSILGAYNYNMNNEENASADIDEDTVVIKAGDLVSVKGFEGEWHIAVSGGEESWTLLMTDEQGNRDLAIEKICNKWNAKGYVLVGYDEVPIKTIFNPMDLLDYGGRDFIINAFKYRALGDNSTDYNYHNMENIEEKFIKQISNLVHNEVPITKEIAIHIADRIIDSWSKTELDPIGTGAELYIPDTDAMVYVGDLFFIDNEYRILVGNGWKTKYYFTTKDDAKISLDRYMFPESSYCIKICGDTDGEYDGEDYDEYKDEDYDEEEIDEDDNNIKYLPIQYNTQWLIAHRHYIPLIQNYIKKIDNKWEEELQNLIPYIRVDNELALHIAYQILDRFDVGICEVGYTTDGQMMIVNNVNGMYYRNNKINIVNLDNLCTDLSGTYLYPTFKKNLKNGDIVYLDNIYAFYKDGKYIALNVNGELKEVTDNNNHVLINKALNFIDILNGKINVDFILKYEDKNSEVIQNMIKLNIQNTIKNK